MLVRVSCRPAGGGSWRRPVVCRSLPVARRFVRRLLRLPCVGLVDVRVLGGGAWRWSREGGWLSLVGRGFFRRYGFRPCSWPSEPGEVAPSPSFVLVGSPSVSCVVGGLRCRSASRSFVARFVAALRDFRRFSRPALVPVSAPVPVGSPSVVCFVSLSRPPLSLPVVFSCSPAGVSALVASLRACLAPRVVAS